MKRIKKIWEKYKIREMVGVILIVFLYDRVLSFLGISCPIQYATGISCAGCGMTRAWIALLHLDFGQAFYFHPLFWLVPIAVGVLLFKNRIHAIVYKIFWIICISLFLIVYGYRLWDSKDTVVVFAPQNGIFFRNLHDLLYILKWKEVL